MLSLLDITVLNSEIFIIISFHFSETQVECLDAIHCKRGYICDTRSNSCIPEVSVLDISTNLSKDKDIKCPSGWEVVQINHKMVCRKICPYNWKDQTQLSCGAHQFCKEEFPNISMSNNLEDVTNKSNTSARFYCETPRCDENGQVRVNSFYGYVHKNFNMQKNVPPFITDFQALFLKFLIVLGRL